MARPGVQAPAARRRHACDCRARILWSARREAHGRREQRGGPQRDRMHAVLLLPVAAARAAAGLVQVGRLSIAHRGRSARRAARARPCHRRQHRGSRLGQQRRVAIPRAAPASVRNRSAERGRARGTGDARRDDRRCEGRLARELTAVNGIHDMGGMHGLGELRYARDEPVFHATWEGRTIALVTALSAYGKWRGLRSEIELIPAADYLRMSYYERWLTALTERIVKS